MTRVAEKTGLERTHLYRKLKQLGVDLSRNKRGGGSERRRRPALGYNLRLSGQVAQLVEQRIENPRVGGSIPPQATRQGPTHTSFWRRTTRKATLTGSLFFRRTVVNLLAAFELPIGHFRLTRRVSAGENDR